jgi:hypothetical protein
MAELTGRMEAEDGLLARNRRLQAGLAILSTGNTYTLRPVSAAKSRATRTSQRFPEHSFLDVILQGDRRK